MYIVSHFRCPLTNWLYSFLHYLWGINLLLLKESVLLKSASHLLPVKVSSSPCPCLSYTSSYCTTEVLSCWYFCLYRWAWSRRQPLFCISQAWRLQRHFKTVSVIWVLMHHYIQLRLTLRLISVEWPVSLVSAVLREILAPCQEFSA